MAAELDDRPLTIDVENDRDLLHEFVLESHEHLARIEQETLILEENPTEATTLNAMFAAFHTFKGTSGLLNLLPIKDLSHELESLLDLARQNKILMTSVMIDLVLEGKDILKKCILQIEEQLKGNKGAPITLSTRDLSQRLHSVIHEAAAVNTVAPATPPGPSQALPSPRAPQAAKQVTDRAMVRVDIHKLDAMVDFVGELVVAHSLVKQDVSHLAAQSERTRRNLSQLAYITGELQRLTLSMRMVPIRPTFQKMQRLVRDLAARAGKHVQLILTGEGTEFDRTLVEAISDPILHMVRNSIDHGIEKPEARLAAGKPEMGSIHLKAFHKAGYVHIEINDDGAGLDKERILRKAVERGLVAPDAHPGEQEIFQLIFSAGLSTAETVSDISGRGVGMDVVRRNVEKLRGKIDIKSAPGRGSTFTITLPLTLAIIDGLLIGVGPERYIIPTLSVRESFRPTPAMISTVQGKGEMVTVRGHLSPLLRLYEHFGIAPLSTNPFESIVVRVESDQQDRCLLVDRLLGKQQVVIKSLGDSYQKNTHLAGAAILGDGRVGLILDINSLVKLKKETE